MKVGEIFTAERIVMGGTGYRYAPVRLTGEVALLSSETIELEPGKGGAPEIQRFTFQCLRPGKAEIQFARFRSFEMDTVIFEEVLPFTVEPATDNRLTSLGAWSSFEAVTAEDELVFNKAMEGFVGVKYVPEKVSKQTVNGVNFRFFCYGHPAVQGEHTFPAIVKIHVAPGGEAHITDIQRVVL
ncbi:protease inhibitor I42 family protein [Bacteroides fragilis]|uniref:protease inhibitor I42 family protein n=1 Tax=Bacteroides fragilis TaxID=817 RepID=UPI00245591E9|nr:protease inhibitor I42 family protein [Bacteroides fragilis]WMI93961.1 protease inhibitor I42 family protein [Bacteroides fragilis]